MRTSMLLLAFMFQTALTAATAHAATPDERRTPLAPFGAQPRALRLSVTAAYLSEFLLHPGAEVGLEYRAYSGRAGAIQGSFLLAPNVGAYTHPRNHTAFFVDFEAGYRLQHRSGVFVDGFIGAGYLHTFVAGPVYTVDDRGEVSRITDMGRPAFMPVVSVGGGYQFRQIAPYLRFSTFGQYPFNEHLLPHFAVLAGVRI